MSVQAFAGIAALAAAAMAQGTQGPSSSRAPYLVASTPNPGIVRSVTSIVTSTDLVPTTGAPTTPFEIAGNLDGISAYDNGDGTVTVIVNHELSYFAGAVRRHGGTGTFLSELIVDKNTLQVISAQDLIHTFVAGDGTHHNVVNDNAIAMGRYCSGDMAAPTAFWNAATGLGTTARLHMCGEEGTASGFAVATVATGPDKGHSYVLPRFNLATNGSGINAVGAWENLLANPFPQDLTVVAGTNDGGTGPMTDAIALYVGTKVAVGNEVERAGLQNGQVWLIDVAGNPYEITDYWNRGTSITSGTRFSLNATSGTMFSRPEDGAWDPTHPNDFWFATTDRFDSDTSTGTNPTIGASGPANQVGVSRLWRLRFDDITNPQLGGEIALIIDGSKAGQKVNMLDNLCVAANGRVFLCEDPGNTTYNPKLWAYDPAHDVLVRLLKFDPAQWGELAVNGGTPGAMLPHTNDKEISGVVDVTHLFPHAADEQVLLLDVQDHSTNPAVATPSSVEGGQLLLVRVALDGRNQSSGVGCGGLTLASATGSQPVLGGSFVSELGGIGSGYFAFVMIGLSNVSFAGIPLPLDLGLIGHPGCWLYQDIGFDGFSGCTSTGVDTAQHTLVLAPDFANAGLEVYLQAWAFDGLGGLQTSNALTLWLGF